MAVVTFVSRLQTSRCLDENDFAEIAVEKLSVEERRAINMHNWKIRKAPS